MVSSMARILSSGGVHVSLLAVSATERVRLVVTLILCREKSFINEFGGLSLVESITDLSASSQSYSQSFAGFDMQSVSVCVCLYEIRLPWLVCSNYRSFPRNSSVY